MANPQPTDAHIRISHNINEEIMASDFSKRQRRILDLILRLSWGCGKKYAIIPRQRDFSVVGITENNVLQEIDWLINAKVIFRDGSKYWFNKDYDQWRVSRALTYTPEKLKDLIRINLVEQDKNFSKQEVETSQNEKKELLKTRSSSVTKLASSKEILKKDISIYALFERFWEAYPKKKSRKQAEKVFSKIDPDDQLLEEMITAIGHACKSDEWQKDNGKYIPHPTTWLNGERWKDAYEEPIPSTIGPIGREI